MFGALLLRVGSLGSIRMDVQGCGFAACSVSDAWTKQDKQVAPRSMHACFLHRCQCLLVCCVHC
jgi:hypothetical protein